MKDCLLKKITVSPSLCFLWLTAFLFLDFLTISTTEDISITFHITEIFQISAQQQYLSHSSIIEGLLSWRRGQNWILTILRCWAPKTYTGVITHRHKNLRIDWVPCDTVHSSGVTTKNSNRVVSFDMEDVNLVVLRSGRHKWLIDASKAAVYNVKALSDSIELSDQWSVLNIPHPQSLSGDIKQCISVSLVNSERHNGVFFL